VQRQSATSTCRPFHEDPQRACARTRRLALPEHRWSMRTAPEAQVQHRIARFRLDISVPDIPDSDPARCAFAPKWYGRRRDPSDPKASPPLSSA
jgi:hypothetical protein